MNINYMQNGIGGEAAANFKMCLAQEQVEFQEELTKVVSL